jgi:hypothetical protein
VSELNGEQKASVREAVAKLIASPVRT